MSTVDQLGYLIAAQPHPDAVFDGMWRSRHSPDPMDGWRFLYACSDGCHDDWASIAASKGVDAIPACCDGCGNPIKRFIPDAGKEGR